jgi:hypothetical protein
MSPKHAPQMKPYIIREIREIHGFNFGSRIEPEGTPIDREQAKGTKKFSVFGAI